MELKFLPMIPEQLKKQRELFLDCFPETRDTPIPTENYYRWKFKSFPETFQNQTAFEYLAFMDQEMVGYYAAIPYRYRFKGQKIPIGMVCDVMTSSKSRGKGVFTKLGAYATDDLKNQQVAFTMGYPIRPEVIPGHLKVGWFKALKLPMYAKPIGIGFLLNKFNLKALPDPLRILARCFNFATKLLGSLAPYKVLSVDPNQLDTLPNYEHFLKKSEKLSKLYLDKNLDFLKWRLSAPGTQYKIIGLVDSNNQLVSLAVTRKVNLEGIDCLALLDFVSTDLKISTMAQLQSAVSDHAFAERCDLLVTMISQYWAHHYKLLFLGFLRTPKFFTLIIKILNFDQTDFYLKDPSTWHLMWIDSDDL